MLAPALPVDPDMLLTEKIVIGGHGHIVSHSLPRVGLSIGERLRRDRWIQLGHLELVGRTASDLERHGRPGTTRDLEAKVGDRAVDGVTAPTARLGIDPADKQRAWSAGDPGNGYLVAGQLQRACLDLLVYARGAKVLGAAQAVAASVQVKHAVGDPWGRYGTDANASDGQVKPGVLGAHEIGAVDPDRALGVLGSPVVTDRTRPAGEVDAPGPRLDPSVEDDARMWGQGLRTRQPRPVHPAGGQVPHRWLVALEAEIPGRVEHLAGGG